MAQEAPVVVMRVAHSSVACPICGHTVHPRRRLDGRFLICPRCSVAWTNPPPAISVQDYVEDRVSTSTMHMYKERDALFRKFQRDFARFVQRAAGGRPGGHALEVGSSVGYLMEALSDIGYTVEGIEPDVQTADAARERGLVVHPGVLDSNFIGGPYDIVVMSHVLEHVEHPRTVLAEVLRVLRPGGILALSQPNYRGLVPQIWGTAWYGWQPNQHYWHFTVDSLRQLFTQTGFDCIAAEQSSLHHAWHIGGKHGILRRAKQAMIAATARVGKGIGLGDQIYLAARAIPRT